MSIENEAKFLAELKEDRKKLNDLINSIEIYLDKDKDKTIRTVAPLNLDSKSFYRKSLSDYVLEYLQEMNKECSSKEILNNLKHIKTESKNFPAMINTILYQLKKNNKVISISRGMWKIKN